MAVRASTCICTNDMYGVCYKRCCLIASPAVSRNTENGIIAKFVSVLADGFFHFASTFIVQPWEYVIA